MTQYRVQVLKANVSTHQYEGEWKTIYPYSATRAEAVAIADDWETNRRHKARITEEPASE